jgi:hypothetical protein
MRGRAADAMHMYLLKLLQKNLVEAAGRVRFKVIHERHEGGVGGGGGGGRVSGAKLLYDRQEERTGGARAHDVADAAAVDETHMHTDRMNTDTDTDTHTHLRYTMTLSLNETGEESGGGGGCMLSLWKEDQGKRRVMSASAIAMQVLRPLP